MHAYNACIYIHSFIYNACIYIHSISLTGVDGTAGGQILSPRLFITQ